MFTTLSLLTALASPAAQATLVEPGKALGGIPLGAAEAELAKFGPVSPGSIDTWRKVGPYEVQLEGGKVVQISLDLSPTYPTVTLAGQGITPKAPEDMARLIEGCGPLQIRTGGNIIECTSGALVGQHMGGLTVRVLPAAKASDQPVCAAYVVPGREGDFANVASGQVICAGNRTLTVDVVQADVLGKLAFNTCQTTAHEGATVVDCPFQGLRLVFGTPEGKLGRVEGIALKQ